MDSTVCDIAMDSEAASPEADAVATSKPSSSPSSRRKGKQRTSEERKADADRWLHWTETCRLLPTKSQHRRLERALDVTRELYNAALEERFTKLARWHQTAKFKPEFQPTVDPATGRKMYPPNPYFPSAFDGHKDLALLRAPEMNLPIGDYPSTLGRGVINRAAKTFQAFYTRKSNGEAGGRPRFKPASRWRTLEFSAVAGVRWVWNVCRPKGLHGPQRPGEVGTHHLMFPPIGALRAHTHRKVPEGSVLMFVKLVRKAGGQWEAHLGFKCPKSATGEDACEPTLGMDWNIGSLAVCSDGFTLPNNRLGRKARKARKRQERLVARAKKGSKTRAKKVKRLAVLREREADARRTERHTGAKRLVDHAVAHGHRAIAVEDIDTAGLMAKKKKAFIGSPSDIPPWETASGQRALKRELADASIGMLKQYTLAKAARAGLGVVLVPAYGTTQACARCGTTPSTKLTLSDRTFSCACGWTADRDVNAGLVALRRGRRGVDPRPTTQAPWSPPMPHPGLAQVGTVGAPIAQAGQKSKTSRKGLGP